MELHSYPKIYNVGHAAIHDLFDTEVYAEEKIDGSQFSFGVVEGELHCRSKGAVVHPEAPQALFAPAVATAVRLFEAGQLVAGWTYRGEAVCKPKHNVLAYNRAPEGGFILFDVNPHHEGYLSYEEKQQEAERLGLEVVPLLFTGRVTLDTFGQLLETTSVLGGQLVEGVVCKPIDPVYGRDGKALMAKHVSERFKEVHRADWKSDRPAKGDVVTEFLAAYRSEARWDKAVIHLQEAGLLTGTPQDIGPLIKAVQEDVFEEEGEVIKSWLLSQFQKEMSRGLASGLPEWYKTKLLVEQFDD